MNDIDKLPLEERMMRAVEIQRMINEDIDRHIFSSELMNERTPILNFIGRNKTLYEHLGITAEQTFEAYKIANRYRHS
jgi:hypothetical protein